MPDAKGRVQVGRDSADSDFNTMGETRGEKAHTMTIAELATHTHDTANARNNDDGGIDGVVSGTRAVDRDIGISSTGSSTPFNVIQPSIVANTAIRIK